MTADPFRPKEQRAYLHGYDVESAAIAAAKGMR